ncbi:hypothetical protein J6590_060866 [Homalodisca vitripennis]|nr:hypothetical protein J6590_060866 [Homalodisca vitripennis]
MLLKCFGVQLSYKSLRLSNIVPEFLANMSVKPLRVGAIKTIGLEQNGSDHYDHLQRYLAKARSFVIEHCFKHD